MQLLSSTAEYVMSAGRGLPQETVSDTASAMQPRLISYLLPSAAACQEQQLLLPCLHMLIVAAKVAGRVQGDSDDPLVQLRLTVMGYGLAARSLPRCRLLAWPRFGQSKGPRCYWAPSTTSPRSAGVVLHDM